MADKTIGELPAYVGDVPGTVKLEIEEGDGTADWHGTLQQIADSAVFTDNFGDPGGLADHIADTDDAHNASAISFAPAAGIAATNTQAAIEEDAGDLADHLADTGGAHAASAISVADAGGFITATNSEDAFTEGFNGKCAVNTVGATGSTETLTMHPIQKMTMDQNCTFTFPTPTTAGHIFMLHLIGAFTPTWPGTVDWPSATPPTYATPSIFVFVTDDSGTTWFGAMIGSGFG